MQIACFAGYDSQLGFIASTLSLLPTSFYSLLIIMANAAAKKAAAARQSASSTYLPIVAALDLLYLILFAMYKQPVSPFQCVMAVTLLGLSYVSYKGVIDNSANHNKNSDALAGGAFLDMMGLVIVVQFGSVLLSDKTYWLLLLIPSVGGFKIYKTVKGGLPGMPNATAPSASAGNEPVSEKDNERRQKRAERRRRKW